MLPRFACSFLVVLAGLAAAASASAQIYNGQTLVEPSLVADTTAIVPGKPFRVGIVLKMAPRWHTYWQYSGDAGLPTKIDWQLPEGFAMGPIEWPLPESDLEPGEIQVYVYGDEVMLIQTLRPPDAIEAASITLKGKVSWLVCEEICVPGDGEVSLTLPVAKTAQAANADLFQKWTAQLPSEKAPPFAVEWARTGGVISGKVAATPGLDAVEFYPLPVPGQIVGRPKITGSAADGFTIEIDVSGDGDLRGVLAAVENGQKHGWWVQAGSTNLPTVAEPANADIPSAEGGLSFWKALLFGFLGGLLLNLMPCVLPVISLKIFGFVRQAGESSQRILLHGLAFTAGVFAWFLGIGVLVLAIKAGGGEVTWAFQFQNPWFVVIIATVVFVFALNLFGVFEITLPGRATNTLAHASGGEGLTGSFFQGVLATLLATPCTAPFLGSALAYAFSQPGPVILLMFACIAAGMALPYLVLSARPGWIRFLPKPGTWMERLKQFMGFPLIATLLWLLYIVGGQRGPSAIVWVAAFLLCLGIACWIYGIVAVPGTGSRKRNLGLVVALVLAVGGGWIFLTMYAAERPSSFTTGAPEGEGIAWQPYSAAKVEELIKEGKPVFVDFTADWCLTCKYNERTAINVPAVRKKFEELGIVPIKADWTNSNPEITAALKKFNRVGVPFYVLYPAGNGAHPITFPEILTESIVLEKLSQARPVSSQ